MRKLGGRGRGGGALAMTLLQANARGVYCHWDLKATSLYVLEPYTHVCIHHPT